MRVVIVEDQALLREGLVALLREQGIDVVAQAEDGAGLLRIVAGHKPDLAIVDVRLPPSFTDEGLRAALEARVRQPGLGVLVLSQYVEPVYTAELLESGEGGIGYLLKERVGDVRGFVDAVQRVARGGTALDREVVAELVRSRTGSPGEGALAALTPREREVLDLMAEGRTNAAIARAMVVTSGAVEKHVSSIFGKLDLPSTDDDHRRVLAVLAYRAASRRRLEVVGEDVISVERGDEALDLILHVGVHHPLEVADERLGAAVEHLVEPLDDGLLEDAGAGPLAVGAAQRDLPMGRAGLVPLDGVDQVRATGAAEMKVVAGLGEARVADRGEGGELVEVDDLDRLARRKDDSANVVGVVGFAAHGDGLLLAPSSAAPALAFTAQSHLMRCGALPLIWWTIGEPSHGGRYACPMPSIGPLELGIVLLIVLIVFGPKRLPGLGRQLGSGMREFKDSITGKDKDDDDEPEAEPIVRQQGLDRARGRARGGGG